MSSMIVAAILLGVCQIIGFLGLSLLIRRAINAKQREIEARAEAAMREWLEPKAEGKPSRFAELLDAGGTIIGAAAARSIMSALSADKSHAARVANGLTDELQGAQNPILGLLAGGKRGKGAAIARLAEVLGPMLVGRNGNNPVHEEHVPRKHRE